MSGTERTSVFDDHFIPEVIDPETGEVYAGENGELVFIFIKEGFADNPV